MATLKELREENRKLKARKEAQEEMLKIQEERKKLARENFQLRHRRKLGVIKKAGSFFSAVGKVVQQPQQQRQLVRRAPVRRAPVRRAPVRKTANKKVKRRTVRRAPVRKRKQPDWAWAMEY